MADFDPATMATSLASYYTQAAQSQITTQTTKASTMSTALTRLKSALTAFDSAVSGLSSTTKTVTQKSATLSSDIGSASASSKATAGTYSFFVEQLASAHQVAYKEMPTVSVPGGPLVVQLGDGSNFTVDLATADLDGDGVVTQSEIARAINNAEDNGGKVAASVVTAGGQTQLILSAGSTGEAGAISLDASGVSDAGLRDALSAAPTELVAAKDAIVWLGAKDTGVRIQQASNTFTGIEGVTVNFTKTMSTGTEPVTLTVATDQSATRANVQSFVDAYNALSKVLADLTKVGDAEAGTSSAALASDASVRSLRTRLSSLVRQEFDGMRLADLGVSIARDGTMSLDATKLDAALEKNPESVDKLFGKATLTNKSGVLGALDGYLEAWTNSTTGHIKRRQDTVQRTQSALTARQTRLDEQYNSAYLRYLKQFTQLQTLTSQMSETTSLFSSLSTAS